MPRRPQKVEQFIKKELSEILRRDVRDPRIGFRVVAGGGQVDALLARDAREEPVGRRGHGR